MSAGCCRCWRSRRRVSGRRRDRERGLLTREAYQEIGGVGGALAQHAEETLSRIGEERTPLVRELFRNLVTAQGTRASREVQELLSIFPKEDERKAAEEVLRELVAARLLTSYEDSVEIIHESLLTALAAARAVAATRTKAERSSGINSVKRRRPGRIAGNPTISCGLENPIESCRSGGRAIRVGSRPRKRRSPRRRRNSRDAGEGGVRIAVASVIAVLVGFMGVFFSLWRRSVLEVFRREAAQILALGRHRARQSTDLGARPCPREPRAADSEPARRFAVEALWHGAAAIVLEANVNSADFSPDGRWLATGGVWDGARLWSVEGGTPLALGRGEQRAIQPRKRFSRGRPGQRCVSGRFPEEERSEASRSKGVRSSGEEAHVSQLHADFRDARVRSAIGVILKPTVT